MLVARELVDQAAKPQIFARAGLLVEGAGRHLSKAGRRWPLGQSPEAMDLTIDVTVGLKNLQECLPFSKDLLKIWTVHK